MDKLKNFLSGYRSYITAFLLGLAHVSVALGWLTWEQVAIVDGILAAFGLAFLRLSIDKLGKTQNPN